MVFSKIKSIKFQITKYKIPSSKHQKFLNPKLQKTNIKQITMTEIQNIKPVLVIEKLRFEIWDLRILVLKIFSIKELNWI